MKIRALTIPVLVAAITALSIPAAAATPLVTRLPGHGLVGTSADDGAKVIAQHWLGHRTVDLTVRSPAVGRDLPVRVIVPFGWTPGSKRTWPLLLALHGGAANYTSWTGNTDLGRLSEPWDVLIAMPEAGRTAAYTDYVSPTRQGPLKWETFHTVELIQILTRGFHASDRRAVLGLSAGGYGAMDYAARHPGLFQAVATFSAALGVNQFPLKQANIVGDQIQGVGFARYGVPGRDQRNWDAHDPFQLTQHLRGTKLYVYSGLIGIPESLVGRQNQAFVSTLNRNGIPVDSRFSLLGQHDWVAWKAELHRAWPFLTTAIGAKSRERREPARR